jgi:predicted TIM-barrel fold metal-dependent hydrolase
MIIEWNAHMFSADTTRYPIHPRATYVPKGQFSPDPLADYLKRMQADKIDRAVLVHPEPYGDDHRLVLDCLEREPDRFKATALYYPRDTDAPARLRDLVAQQPKIIAIRFHATHRDNKSYLDSFADPGVVALWKTAAELNLIVELHIGPYYAPQVVPLITEYSGTTVLIDHLAEPQIGDGVEYAEVLELARFDHVYMKLSGLNHFATDAPLYTSARPFTRHVVEAFGPTHMVWGSGSPDIVDAHMPEYSEEDRALVKGLNLIKLLNWQ